MALMLVPNPPGCCQYVEFRKWCFWWGLFLDSEVLINEVIREYHNKGYECIQVETTSSLMPNLTLFRIILIWIVTLISLGFISYYVGPSFLFKPREETQIAPTAVQKGSNVHHQRSRTQSQRGHGSGPSQNHASHMTQAKPARQQPDQKQFVESSPKAQPYCIRCGARLFANSGVQTQGGVVCQSCA